jgi:ferredoxin
LTRKNVMPTVSIQDLNKTFEVKDGDVIYDALSDQGFDLPHGCLSGSCGACRIEVISGIDNLSLAGAIEQNTVEAVTEEFAGKYGQSFVESKTIRLSCRAKVKGDVVINPIK